MKQMLGGLVQEFKEFALKGNVVDLGVGLAVGTSFGSVISSLIRDILLPKVYAVMPRVPEGSDVGGFLGSLANFGIVSLFAFSLAKVVNHLKRGEEPAPTSQECPFCFFSIPIQATRCGHCTSPLEPIPANVPANQ